MSSAILATQVCFMHHTTGASLSKAHTSELSTAVVYAYTLSSCAKVLHLNVGTKTIFTLMSHEHAITSERAYVDCHYNVVFKKVI